MSTSLRDQLVKAGLITEKQAQQAAQQQHRQARNPAVRKPEQQASAQQGQAAKAARDLELNRRQQEKAERKARRAQVEQLIEQCRLAKPESEDLYSFVDDKKIRRLTVTPALREQLSRGELAIVRYKQHYELVPADAVARIRERDERAVILHNDAPPPVDQNDPYKDAVIPDDLMW
jgi:uncharacterized protein